MVFQKSFGDEVNVSSMRQAIRKTLLASGPHNLLHNSLRLHHGADNIGHCTRKSARRSVYTVFPNRIGTDSDVGTHETGMFETIPVFTSHCRVSMELPFRSAKKFSKIITETATISAKDQFWNCSQF